MRVVIVSDTHNRLARVAMPDGDLLIHCGDFCSYGEMSEVEKFSKELSLMPYKYKIVVAGNHDWPFERENSEARKHLANVTYLEDDLVEIEGLKIYGSPWQPRFMNWAFNLPRQSKEMAEKWDKIPDNTDILVTHSPPHGILDRTKFGQQVGCELLRKRVEEIKPRLHCFGHIHESYGQQKIGETLFVNASTLNIWYQPGNKPIVVDLP